MGSKPPNRSETCLLLGSKDPLFLTQLDLAKRGFTPPLVTQIEKRIPPGGYIHTGLNKGPLYSKHEINKLLRKVIYLGPSK